MRILVVQTAFVGDVVLTVPLLRELRTLYAGAELNVLTTDAGRRLLGGLPWIDRRLALDKRWDRKGIRSYWGVACELLDAPFDLSIAAQRSIRTGVLLTLSRARMAVGFAGAPGAWAYHTLVPWDPGRHAARRYLELARPLGSDPIQADPTPRLGVEDQARERVGRLLRSRGLEAGRSVCIAPGSARVTKRWLAEGFARVAAAVVRRGLDPVLIGSADERRLCDSVAELSGVERIPNLAGRMEISDLVALLAGAAALVGNDSGPAHVAAAVGTPVVAVFGPTASSQGCTPRGGRTRIVEHSDLECRPCSRNGPRNCPLEHFRCMRELQPERVIDELEAVLGTGRTVHRAAPRRPLSMARGQGSTEVAPG